MSDTLFALLTMILITIGEPIDKIPQFRPTDQCTEWAEQLADNLDALSETKVSQSDMRLLAAPFLVQCFEKR